METRVAKPTSDAEAARLAREIYGLETHATALPGEYDDNFRLVDVGGDPQNFLDQASKGRASEGEDSAFVLKVMHPAREASFVEMQALALRWLAEKLPQRELPRVIASRENKLFTTTSGADGEKRIVWLLSYVPGDELAHAKPHTEELLRSLGGLLGEMDAALLGFEHAAAHRELKWDSARAGWIGDAWHVIEDQEQRTLVRQVLAMYEREVTPLLPVLRRSIIYGDANDHNVLVGEPWSQPRRVRAVIDFGDMHYGLTVSEPAIAAAYAILRKEEPLRVAGAVAAGYHAVQLLTEDELRVFMPLMAMRLAVSVVISAERKKLRPQDPYMTVSEAPAWEALGRLAKIHPRLAHYTLRAACGLPANPRSAAIANYLRESAGEAAPLLHVDQRAAAVHVFDLSVASAFLGADPRNAALPEFGHAIDMELHRSKAVLGIGRYDEPRLLYNAALFQTSGNPTDEHRTIHLGMDLFAVAGTAVHAPLAGVVEAFADNTADLDYGPVVILKHTMHSASARNAGDASDGAEHFYTLYGHLSRKSLAYLKIGQAVQKGEQFAALGDVHENGGWLPHLHFQIITDLLERGTDFPGVAKASERALWTNLSPDPNLLMNIPAKYFPALPPSYEETLAARRELLGKNLSLSYDKPLKIVRGWKQYLYDDIGRAYLDVYNNVPLVGHSHPRVVRAAQEQLALLNTNTRYLHDNATCYAARLTQLLPAPLRVCYFVNSGSEANELALRLARAHTRREDIVVLDHAYHGHTGALIDISPYKFNGPGGRGKKPWVHVAPLPDDYRGAFRRDDAPAGEKYAEAVAAVIREAEAGGRQIAAFIAETLPSVGGQIVLPANYLAETYRHVRAAGAVCIADEVQVGFGRLGTHFWGFETQGVIPDIVVLGKPIGNAFPLAAVITTQEIAASFANGMEFFSTFGGNPVACAAGLAVLEVLRDEKLQENALEVGNYLKAELTRLQNAHALIGEVRGAGLFQGIDLVLHRETREPAPKQASYIVNRLRERGILAGTDGPHHNVIKLRPPLVFTKQDADLFVATLDAVLAEDAAQIPTAGPRV
jgi:4-aminobutyrate aminotransferase-like enzyme/Ser/Thr protein kinase RdoA (MazF antagonist)